jgi:hypothetical protein
MEALLKKHFDSIISFSQIKGEWYNIDREVIAGGIASQ